MPEPSIHIFTIGTDRLGYDFDYNRPETTELRNRSYEYVSMDDLRRIALWKIGRVIDVPPSLMNELRILAAKEDLVVDSKESIDLLEALVKCKGVGYPMASTFLKFIRPDIFPIIDVRAYRALTGKQLRDHEYNTELYLEYVHRLMEIAVRLDMSLASVDEQLYCYDKERNGAIRKTDR